jgi:hypothetical protein
MKLTKAALKAGDSVKAMFAQSTQFQDTYQDLWNFIGKVRLPQPFCPVIKFFKFEFRKKINKINSIFLRELKKSIAK